MAPEVFGILVSRLALPFHSDRILDHLNLIMSENADILAMKPDSIVSCARELVKKIQSIIISEWPSQLLTNKCWNCIRTIVDIPAFAPLISLIEEQVRSLIPYLSS
jgi:hypothetical protein